MCKKNYFNHDCDARNDERVIRLRIRYGAAGYGIYFMLLELLHASPDCTLETDYKALAFDLRVPACRIKAIVEQSGLFALIDDGRRFYSERLARDIGEQEKLERRRAEAGRMGADARWKAPEGMANASKMDGKRMLFRCVCHSEAPSAQIQEEKEEEREKEEETFPPITP